MSKKISLKEIFKTPPKPLLESDTDVLKTYLETLQDYDDEKKLDEAIPSPYTGLLYQSIRILYNIVKKNIESELQRKCNPLNYIIFDDPDDYHRLDHVIKYMEQKGYFNDNN